MSREMWVEATRHLIPVEISVAGDSDQVRSPRWLSHYLTSAVGDNPRIYGHQWIRRTLEDGSSDEVLTWVTFTEDGIPISWLAYDTGS